MNQEVISESLHQCKVLTLLIDKNSVETSSKDFPKSFILFLQVNEIDSERKRLQVC